MKKLIEKIRKVLGIKTKEEKEREKVDNQPTKTST
mgnify:CR=1 FL=1